MSSEITAKMTGEDIVGYETMLKVTPNDAELHDDVALLYLGWDSRRTPSAISRPRRR